MRLVLLLFTLLFCNGCLSHLVCHQFSRCTAEYPINKMDKLEGGITENNNFAITYMSNEKKQYLHCE